MYDSDEGSTLRGIFLTGVTAFLLSAAFIFCFHLVDPDVINVEPEVTKYESFFYHPDNNDTTYEPEEPQNETDTDTPVSAGEWWVNFFTLGMLLSSGTCLACICIAEYEKHI